jgi:tRNA-specific 2-thiouridylase
LVKDEVREIARQNGYEKIATKKESQEICFVTDNNYRTFLKENVENVEDKIKEGDFLDTSGKVLGKHKGYPFYTIGQRKGLNIALGHPAYVTQLDPVNNTVTLGKRDELNRREMWVENLNMMKYASIDGEMEAICKIRYNSEGILSRLTQDGDKIKVEFYADAWAITSGQSAVFYEGDDDIGGGIII